MEKEQSNWGRWVKQQRELQDLTQQELANSIGATPLTVSRWERGVKLPSSYYRNKLSALFGGRLDIPIQERTSGKTTTPLGAGETCIRDPSLPPQPAATTGLVGRDEIVRQLRLWLSTHRGSLGIKGMYGVGKTALAAELAHDTEVQKHFSGGILWVGLGREPNVPGLLRRWGSLLEIAPIEMEKLTTIDAWQKALHEAIGLRRMLLIVDDAWKAQEALAFKVGGANCSHLVTTRFREIAFQFAREKIVTLEELSEDNGLQLLKALAPEIVTRELNEARELAQSVGGLPLALIIMGKYLQMQADSLQPRRVRTAIDRLYRAEERLRLTMLQAPLERSTNLSVDAALSLQAAIEVSEQQLDAVPCAVLRALSVFPVKPNSFSEAAALAVCNAEAENLDILIDTGLLEMSGLGRYTLHQTIADYARVNHKHSDAEERMAMFFVSYVEAHATDYDLLELEIKNVQAAFQCASRHGMLTDFVRGVKAFAPFLVARGVYSEAEMYLNQAQQAACSLSDDVSLAVTYLYLGRIAELRGEHERANQLYHDGLSVARKMEQREIMSTLLAYWGEMLLNRGNYLQAEQYLQEGLQIAQELGDAQKMSILFRNLGEAADTRGNFVQGNALYLQGLSLARQVGDCEIMSTLLQNMGAKEAVCGNYEQANEYFREGLACARKIGHRQRISAVLNNMGKLAVMRNRYQEAEILYLESLELAQKISNPLRVSSTLQNLGNLEMLRKKYADAASYLDESLAIAYEIGYGWLISETYCEYGELYLKQEMVEKAEKAFEKALGKAREIAGQELIAVACFGLARVARMQGEMIKARSLAEESMGILKVMGHETTKQVEQWLLKEVPRIDALEIADPVHKKTRQKD